MYPCVLMTVLPSDGGCRGALTSPGIVTLVGVGDLGPTVATPDGCWVGPKMHLPFGLRSSNGIRTPAAPDSTAGRWASAIERADYQVLDFGEVFLGGSAEAAHFGLDLGQFGLHRGQPLRMLPLVSAQGIDRREYRAVIGLCRLQCRDASF
jgi:hypothetical protein